MLFILFQRLSSMYLRDLYTVCSGLDVPNAPIDVQLAYEKQSMDYFTRGGLRRYRPQTSMPIFAASFMIPS